METPLDFQLYKYVMTALIELLGARTYFASKVLTPYCYTIGKQCGEFDRFEQSVLSSFGVPGDLGATEGLWKCRMELSKAVEGVVYRRAVELKLSAFESYMLAT